ncbi:HAD hydrolase-like protein [Undibacterium sp. Ji50W]|uniref:HAD hydrolase-like protein n=1 Tax=Undibacterium sp. Ji50W TaxID=3413041 RepID=UPI003BF2D518
MPDWPQDIMEDSLIKLIFFDYDGVLTTDKTGSLTTNRYLSKATGLEFSRVKNAISRYNNDLILGKTTYSRIWGNVCEELGCEINISLLKEAFESTPINAPMFSLAQQLKSNYAIGIITDNKKDRFDHLKITQKLDKLFSPIVVSAEIGMSKQGTGIFLHALDRASAVSEECIFIDNNRDNLIPATMVGFRTIFYDDEKNDIEALVLTLRNMGVILDKR